MPTLETLSTRRADFRPRSFDPDKLTVEAVISTGAPVRRQDARGAFVERLDLDAIDPRSLAGVPVLDAHRQGSARDVVGIIESARREAGAMIATVRFSSRDDVEPIVRDVRDGILPSVSIGYAVAKWRESSDPQSGERVRTAVTWAIREVSFVPLGADPHARIRSTQTMPTATTTETTESPSIVTPDPTPPETRAAIRQLARSAGLTTEWADAQIDAGADVTAARASAFVEMQRRSPTIRVQVGPSNDDPAVILTRRQDAIFARMTGTAPSEAARPFMGDRLIDHARAILTMRGQSVAGMTGEDMVRAAQHGTSDFPNLLTGVGNRTLMAAYEAAPNPLKALARRTTLPDFRAGSKLRLGEIGKLQPVSESGEIKSTSRAEAVESYALDTYASIFSLSRKAILNDDLGAFRDWSIAAGKAAAETEADLLVTLLTQSAGAGPLMGDGVRLFHATHGNVGTPDDPTVNPVSEARIALRSQKGLDGTTPINATPKFLLVHPERETEGEQLLATIYAAQVGEVNPFTGKLSLLVEARLPDEDAWYVFADPAVLPVLEYAYLSSAQGPQMASREGWDVLGQEFRVVLDFGAGAIDWRGAFRNAGG